MLKSLNGIVAEFKCLQCSYKCFTLLTSERHFHKCPRCSYNHKLEIIDINLNIKPAKEGDIYESNL